MMGSGLDILSADRDLVVVNKPGGVLAVPGRGPDKQDCITSRIRAIFPDCIVQPAVHRLDMATSGLMALALTKDCHRNLSQQFAEREVVKRYEALLEGQLDAGEGEITLSFRLDPENRPYQVYDPVQGKKGVTKYRVLGHEKRGTRVEFFPQTGRTHQLRLHASHPLGLGHPILGDALYGTGKDGEIMFLHATGLQFRHPVTGQQMCFVSPPAF